MAKAHVNEFQAAFEQSEQFVLLQAHAIAALKHSVSTLRALVPASAMPKPARAARVVPADELLRVAAMAAAREQAIRMGCSVKV